MDMDLKGKVAIVTGASRGYGAGIAKVLKSKGVEVWITGRKQGDLDTMAKRLGVNALIADVVSGKDWDRLIARVMEKSGRIDILVNNAGSAISIKPLENQTDDDIERSIAVNLTGALLGCRRAASIMKKQGSGTIINISSICQKYAWPGWSVYSAAKAGLAKASQSLYLEVREHGVRVTTLLPSWGVTDFTNTTPDLNGAPSNDPEIRKKCTKPEELGDVVAHICSLPQHLVTLEYTLVPTIQEIMPL